MDTYADDLAALIETLDLGDAVLVGHSTGGCEVARYIGRHGTSRLSEAALVGTPLRREIDANPDVLPTDAFEGIRASLTEDRAQFYRDLSAPYYGQPAWRPGFARPSGMRSGSGGCRSVSRPHSTASRRSPRWT
jgi:non-heme chloroperoxidase